MGQPPPSAKLGIVAPAPHVARVGGGGQHPGGVAQPQPDTLSVTARTPACSSVRDINPSPRRLSLFSPSLHSPSHPPIPLLLEPLPSAAHPTNRLYDQRPFSTRRLRDPPPARPDRPAGKRDLQLAGEPRRSVGPQYPPAQCRGELKIIVGAPFSPWSLLTPYSSPPDPLGPPYRPPHPHLLLPPDGRQRSPYFDLGVRIGE